MKIEVGMEFTRKIEVNIILLGKPLKKGEGWYKCSVIGVDNDKILLKIIEDIYHIYDPGIEFTFSYQSFKECFIPTKVNKTLIFRCKNNDKNRNKTYQKSCL